MVLTRDSEEHRRRAPNCIFFTLSAQTKAKTGRGKKSRVSKASRVSTQSNLSVLTEDIAGMEIDPVDEGSLVQPEFEPADAHKPTRGVKKATKNKKATNKTKGKMVKNKAEEATQVSSIVEPEDDDFEVKIERAPAKPITGRKRTSDEMNIADDQRPFDENSQTGLEIEQPSAKRRATKSRGSTLKKVPISTLEYSLDDEETMTSAEIMPPPPIPNPKRGVKGIKKRASSTVRKASTRSTASKASLRAAVSTDDEVEISLEADLEKGLTDNEEETEAIEEPKPKSRRLTRTRPDSWDVTASKVAASRTTRADVSDAGSTNMNVVDSFMKDATPDIQEYSPVVHIALKAIDHAKEEIVSETRKPKPTGGRSGSKANAKKKNIQPNKSEEVEVTQETTIDPIADDDQPSKQLKQAKNRQVSHQLPSEDTQQSIASKIGGFDAQSVLNSSVISSATTGDDSGHETDVSKASQGRPKYGRKPSAPSKKSKSRRKAPTKGRKPKGAAASQRQIEPERQQSLKELVLNERILGEQMDPVLEPTVGQPKEQEQSMDKPAKSKTVRSFNKVEPLSAETTLQVQTQASEDVPPPAFPTPELSADPIDTHGTPERQSITPQPKLASKQQTPKAAVASPQSSDAENQPPSSRPSVLRPPLSFVSPSKGQTGQRIPLAAITPTASPSKNHISQLQTTLPWTAVEIEKIFAASPAVTGEDEENVFGIKGKGLSSPEKMMSVEGWIKWNAQKGEEKLRKDCERLVGRFENEGVRALKCLEGIVCAD
ncbi:MAG: hypothetical protein LQ351_001238 [Letrouitia transgressa]|nr:MAG: hypothetical protein LQ351_001238 [Letrouitia transgressa]